MSIQASDIVWRRAAENSDLTTNGGRITHTLIPNGVKNSVFPDLSQAERTAGLTRYRKVGIHIANDDDLALLNGKVFVETYTPGDDHVTFFPGNHLDTQDDITGSERQYGAGQLFAPANVGANTIEVMTEDASLDVFQDGDTIRISNKDTVDAETGTTEYHVISGAPVYDGDKATITLVGTLAYGYSAANTRVASVYEVPASVKGTVDNLVVTSGSGGTYTGTIVADSIGAVEDTWTLTFTSPTAFNISGANTGAVGTGTVGSNTSPVNPNFTKPYFTIPSAGFGGTFANGNTIVFQTHPAIINLWYKQIVPAGSASIAGNNFILGIEGESE